MFPPVPPQVQDTRGARTEICNYKLVAAASVCYATWQHEREDALICAQTGPQELDPKGPLAYATSQPSISSRGIWAAEGGQTIDPDPGRSSPGFGWQPVSNPQLNSPQLTAIIEEGFSRRVFFPPALRRPGDAAGGQGIKGEQVHIIQTSARILKQESQKSRVSSIKR